MLAESGSRSVSIAIIFLAINALPAVVTLSGHIRHLHINGCLQETMKNWCVWIWQSRARAESLSEDVATSPDPG